MNYIKKKYLCIDTSSEKNIYFYKTNSRKGHKKIKTSKIEKIVETSNVKKIRKNRKIIEIETLNVKKTKKQQYQVKSYDDFKVVIGKISCKCGRNAVFMDKDAKMTTHCYDCRKEDMIHVEFDKLCINCRSWIDPRYGQKKYEYHCGRCYQALYPHKEIVKK